MAHSRLLVAAAIAPLFLVSGGCTALKPENLWKLNRGTESMNEEAYYSIPADPFLAEPPPPSDSSPADSRPAG